MNRIKSGNKPGISTVRGYNAPCFESVVHCFMSFALVHRDIGDRKDRNQNGIFYDIFPVELARYHDEIMSLLLQSALIYCMQNFRDTVKFLYAGTRLAGRTLEITNYVFENYQNVTLRGLAHHFGYSEPYLCKLFREEAGSTFTQILRDFKLKQAKKLLQTTDKKLNEICDTIGYSDTTQFIRDFKQQYGNTPAKYRKAFQENQ